MTQTRAAIDRQHQNDRMKVERRAQHEESHRVGHIAIRDPSANGQSKWRWAPTANHPRDGEETPGAPAMLAYGCCPTISVSQELRR
jgi:hypothetical protein